jgi:hypothetical protein
MILEKTDLPKFKSPSAFVTFNSGEAEGKCGHWGEVDRFGYCLDEDCRHKRLVKALIAGEARKLPDGTLVWNVSK